MKRTLYIVAGSVASLAVLAMLVSAWLWPVINAVETGATPEYPEVQPQYYATDPERIYDEVLASLKAMPRWSVVDSQASTLAIDARRRAPIRITDDVSIRVEPVTEYVSQVHVRSEASAGISPTDFGRNARNIDELFTDLDDRLGAVKFEPGREDKDSDAVDGPSPQERETPDVGEG